jgi:hypothetical protein
MVQDYLGMAFQCSMIQNLQNLYLTLGINIEIYLNKEELKYKKPRHQHDEE